MHKKGFSLLEVVITTMVVAILAAAVIPSVNSYTTNKKVASAAVLLDSLARAYLAVERSAVARHPGTVADLVDPIASTSSTSCNGSNGGGITTYGGQAGSWVGPYFDHSFNPVTGLDIGIGVVRNLVKRNPANNAPGTVNIFVDGLSLEEAFALNAMLDGYSEASASSHGFFRWNQSGNTVTEGFIVMSVDNSC